MTRDTAVDSRQEILHTAGRLFQQQGYDATSMNDIAAALKLSKGGLYHHFQSKDEILFHIMSHAMDITEERVINRARGIADPEDRLRALLGMINWIYQWYQPGGPLTEEDISRQYTEIFFAGAFR